MIQKILKWLNSFPFFASALIIGASLALGASVYARVDYPPAAMLMPGDIIGSMIRTGTITGTNISTTTTMIVATSTATNVIANTITATSSLVAYATTTFNGVPIMFPSSQGSAGSTIQNNGSGQLSWVNGSDWVQLCENTLGSANASISCSAFAGRRDLRIVADIEVSAGGNTDFTLQFNSDTAANYQWKHNYENAASLHGESATAVHFGGVAVTGGYIFVDAEVLNASSHVKLINGHFANAWNGVASPMMKDEWSGTWWNTATQITTITLGDNGDTMIAGTRITVYGKKD